MPRIIESARINKKFARVTKFQLLSYCYATCFHLVDRRSALPRVEPKPFPYFPTGVRVPRSGRIVQLDFRNPSPCTTSARQSPQTVKSFPQPGKLRTQ